MPIEPSQFDIRGGELLELPTCSELNSLSSDRQMGPMPRYKNSSQEKQSVFLLIPVASGGLGWSLPQSLSPFLFPLGLFYWWLNAFGSALAVVTNMGTPLRCL